MIKTFHRYILTALTALTLGLLGVMPSCSDELDVPMPEDPGAAKDGYITVSLSCSDAVSRAGETEPGVDNLNENRIETVTLCFWQPSGDNTASKPAYMQTFRDVNAVGKATFNIPLTSEILTQLFKEDGTNKCNVYAAVNVEPGNATTVEELRQLVVNSEFESKMVQPRFTMDGDGEATLTNTGRAVTGSVKVKRSAAKITLALNVEGSIEEKVNGEEITWTPNLAGMRVWLMQGVKESTLTPAPTVNMASDCYFNTPDKNEYLFGQSSDAKYTKSQTTPFYTYPNKWTLENNERHRTHMVLSVPWTPDGGQSYRTCYYQVPVVPMTSTETVRNISYHINLHVGVLGSFVPEEPEEIEAEYWVADWSNENIDVDIKDYRYLVVDQNEFTVDNETSISIPFYTSHPTVVTDVKMTFYRYNFSDQGSEFYVRVFPEQNKKSAENGEAVYTANFDNNRKTLDVSHELKVWVPYNSSDREISLTTRLNGTRAPIDYTNDIDEVRKAISFFKKSDIDEYSRVEFEVTVQHRDVSDGTSGIDQNLYKETIKITQYPGIYITAVQNYAGNLEHLQYTQPPLGNTIINGRYDEETLKVPTSGVSRWPNIRKTIYNYRNWNNSIGLGFPPNYYNWNPNLYLVTITTLPSNTNYTIGDPRSYNINNDLSNNHGTYTVDGGTTDVFRTEYWVFQKGNQNQAWCPNNPNSWHWDGYQTSDQSQMKPWYREPYFGTDWELYEVPGFVQAPALGESSQRTLKYYYPTRESNDNRNTIAPKFRICSSYGGTSSYMTREMSRRRAAAYQELGYCAGRWRLPTFAEVEFVMQLAADKKIPRLFGTNASGTWFYWCAQGAVRVPDGTVTNPNIAIVANPSGGASGAAAAPFTGDNYRDHARFVYDEWYWGSETLTPSASTLNANRPIYTFTWGDRPKTSPLDE